MYNDYMYKPFVFKIPSCKNNDGCSAGHFCLNHATYSNICIPDWSDSGVPLLMKYPPTMMRSRDMKREGNRDAGYEKRSLLLEFPWGAFIRVLSFPKGIDIPGKPANEAGTVKTSLRYILIGSSCFSFKGNAALGAVGVKIKSQSEKT